MTKGAGFWVCRAYRSVLVSQLAKLREIPYADTCLTELCETWVEIKLHISADLFR